MKTGTMTGKEALRSYGAWHEKSKGYHVEVQHPTTGKWIAVSGGTSWSENDDIILGVFTGTVSKTYDEYGSHDSPHFTHIVKDGAIATTATTVLNVRNVR